MKQKLILTEREVKLVQQSLQALPVARKVDHSMFYGKHIRFGYYSDPHCGEKHFKEPLWHAMVKYFKKDGIEDVYCPGDKLNLSPNFAICWKLLKNYVLDYIT